MGRPVSPRGVISARTGRLMALNHFDGGHPHGLCYFPEPGRYSIGHNGIYSGRPRLADRAMLGWFGESDGWGMA